LAPLAFPALTNYKAADAYRAASRCLFSDDNIAQRFKCVLDAFDVSSLSFLSASNAFLTILRAIKGCFSLKHQRVEK